MENSTALVNKHPLQSVTTVNREYVERVRGLILEIVELGVSKREAAALAGYSRNYLTMLLNHKTFPKTAEAQLMLIRTFENLRNDVRDNKRGVEKGDEIKN